MVFQEAVDKLFSRFLLQNEDASVLICQEILAGLSAPLKNKLQQGLYTKVGGYQLFCQDMEEIVVKYNSQSHRGEKVQQTTALHKHSRTRPTVLHKHSRTRPTETL